MIVNIETRSNNKMVNVLIRYTKQLCYLNDNLDIGPCNILN